MYPQKAADPNPLNIILVKSDSKGDRLLFRYPYAADTRPESRQHNRRKNPYALTIAEDLLQSPPPQTSNISKGHLTGFTDEVLSTLFAVKAELCERKFELKVNDVRFVGHPTLLPSSGAGAGGGGGAGGGSVGGGSGGAVSSGVGGAGGTASGGGGGSSVAAGSAGAGSAASGAGAAGRGGKEPSPSIILIHIVFALRATASHSIVKCYYDLSKRLGVALRHEERRCGYLSRETRAMVTAHDDLPHPRRDHHDDSPFDLILRRSPLARDMKAVYDELCSTGIVHIRVNRWIEVSFCLPQKVHQSHKKDFIVEPETINRCLQALRPYHGILLLVEPHELLDSLPPDASPALVRLIRTYSPLKSLQTLAADADLTLSQVFQLAGHLLYWAKATVIYPLCESNVYVIAPDAPDAHLVERFSEQFPGMNLLQVMADFSLPSSVGQRSSPLGHPQQQQQLVQAVVWMLRHRVLMQLHTYVNCFPTPHGPGRTTASGRPSVGGGAGAGEAGSLQSTPDEQLSLSASGCVGAAAAAAAGAVGGGRAASESDLSSTLSDDLAPAFAAPFRPSAVGALHAHGLSAALPPHAHAVSNGAFNAAYYGYVGGGGGGGGGGSAASTGDEASSFVSPLPPEDDPGVQALGLGLGLGLGGGSLLQEELLAGFSDEERAAILRIPAASYAEDLQLLVRLYRRGYLDGHHHLEEMMYLENLRRSTLLQLLDKFRDILVTHETEDPAIAMFYPHSHAHWHT